MYAVQRNAGNVVFVTPLRSDRVYVVRDQYGPDLNSIHKNVRVHWCRLIDSSVCGCIHVAGDNFSHRWRSITSSSFPTFEAHQNRVRDSSYPIQVVARLGRFLSFCFDLASVHLALLFDQPLTSNYCDHLPFRDLPRSDPRLMCIVINSARRGRRSAIDLTDFLCRPFSDCLLMVLPANLVKDLFAEH